MQDLLGKVLARGVNHLFRRGIDRGYVAKREDLAGIRGKLAVGETAKRALRARARAAWLGGNRRLYHFLLSVCRLLYESSLVDKTTGRTAFPDFRREEATMWALFDALARGRGPGTGKLHSANLYQLLAYLRNRQATRPDGPEHEGILLYPQVGDQPLRAKIRLEGFRIQARTVNLDQDWRLIHKEMLETVGATTGHR